MLAASHIRVSPTFRMRARFEDLQCLDRLHALRTLMVDFKKPAVLLDLQITPHHYTELEFAVVARVPCRREQGYKREGAKGANRETGPNLCNSFFELTELLPYFSIRFAAQ